MGAFWTMEINFEDNIIIKKYITSCLKDQNQFIELLCNSYVCNHISITQSDISININNVQLLINYLLENNFIITGWRISATHNLFNKDYIFQILDILYTYFKKINKNGVIIFPNNYEFIANQNQKNIFGNYIIAFSEIGVKIVTPYQVNFCDCNNNNSIFDFLQLYEQELNLIITNNLEKYYDNYYYWKQIILKYNLKLPNIILDKNIDWKETDYPLLKSLIQLRIQDRFNYFHYDIEKFTKHIFNNDNTILKIADKDDLLKIEYYDKIKNNILPCKLSNSLTINTEDLIIQACCGLSHNIFKGGKFLIENNKIVDIIAEEGINGYINQKIANAHFMLDCYACTDKYFCQKGCRALQFKYSTEPYLPIKDICSIQQIILNTLIENYHNLGIFNYLFSQTLENRYKHELIKILKQRGYPEYEFKYSE